MNWVTGIAMYIMIWWIVLFAVLPFGTRPVVDPDAATGWRGAPEKPGMWRKVLITTLVAGVVWGLLYLIVRSDWLSFRHGWLAMPEG